LTAPAAITAQLVDVRNIAAHRCVRLELHVPAEQAGLVMAAFGWPTMADPVPVALARLQTTPEPIAKPEAPKERRPFSELPYSQQAAMRCNDENFQSFCASYDPVLYQTHAEQGDEAPALAADIIRRRCGVSSRSSIIKNTPAGDQWEALEAEYYAWQRGIR
jgi:hypothetical protein